MKNLFLILLITVGASFVAKAQKDSAQLLKEPSTWSFERFGLPPVFAPDFPYKGAEELRFSPGMFHKDSSDYFTYAFAAELDGINSMPGADIKNYLFLYFKGLCGTTAKDRSLKIDTGQITVSLHKKNAGTGDSIYNATLHVFGVFTDGAPVILNMEIKVLINRKAKKTYLIFIASPEAKTSETWTKLYKIQQEFKIP